jgi:hypothetical protein
MRLDAHRARAQSIERSLRHCGVADYETVIEACMLAGTHWLNILLHRKLLSAPESDAIHAEFMSLADRRKAAVVIPDALRALDTIEALRTTHVRGDLDGGQDAARRALGCLAVLREQALAEDALAR